MNKLVLLTLGCALLLGSVALAPNASAAQSGRSPVYHFGLTYNGELVGQVVVKNANAQRQAGLNRFSRELRKTPNYLLVAKGLTPNTEYTFGYTTMEEPYVIGSKKTTRTGALVINGTFPVEDPESLASGQFWVMETPPTYSSGWLNEFVLGNFYGWFVTKLACYYSTDGGVTWTESSHTDGIPRGEIIRVELSDLGVPDGALVRIHAIVVGGKDRTGSEIFRCSYMPVGVEFSHRLASYYIDGVTWNPLLSFNGTVDMR